LNSYEALKNKIVGTEVTEYYWSNDPTHFNIKGNQIWAEAQLDMLLDPRNALLPTVSAPASESSAKPAEDFVFEGVRMRTNRENSWNGVLNKVCGSDHSIYVHVVDAAGVSLNDVLIGDKYGNFEVPTGPDGAGKVRILVWNATMELAVVGHQDGSRYTSPFTPPLSTLDEKIPLDWLQEAGYCESLEDCQRRVSNNQLCRGHYSYDVLFRRTW
jgi:hypothetical protein